MTSNFPIWRHLLIFFGIILFFLSSLVTEPSFMSISIVTGSGVMTISFYKGLTRDLEIGNTPAWVLPNIWGLGQVRNTKFGMSVSNKMLLNAAKCQGYSFYRFWVIKEKPTGRGEGITPHNTQIRVKMCQKSFLKSLWKRRILLQSCRLQEFFKCFHAF